MLTKQFKYHGVPLLCPSKMLLASHFPKMPLLLDKEFPFTLLEDTRKELKIPGTGTIHIKEKTCHHPVPSFQVRTSRGG